MWVSLRSTAGSGHVLLVKRAAPARVLVLADVHNGMPLRSMGEGDLLNPYHVAFIDDTHLASDHVSELMGGCVVVSDTGHHRLALYRWKDCMHTRVVG
jgi:hypothetical protein